MAKVPKELKEPKEVEGKLIAVEGLDGSGKSTQIRLLKRWLELEGYKVFFTEWNSSELVRQATRKGKKKKLLTPTTFSLIHATDFADRYERQILPLLKGGYIVLADRYVYTAFARDSVRGCDKEWLRKLYKFARKPDITYFFEVPLDVALNRILEGRPTLKYHEAGMDMNFSKDPYESFKIFQGKIYEEYGRIFKEFPAERVNATLPSEQQQANMRDIVKKRINLPDFKLRTQKGGKI
ncbi:MAG TPA: dTMP kinase [bacterium]|jgi:dTMP kinase|nr:dTMP kinase [bacterium]